jgi:hypothetical protein
MGHSQLSTMVYLHNDCRLWLYVANIHQLGVIFYDIDVSHHVLSE